MVNGVIDKSYLECVAGSSGGLANGIEFRDTPTDSSLNLWQIGLEELRQVQCRCANSGFALRIDDRELNSPATLEECSQLFAIVGGPVITVPGHYAKKWSGI